MSVEFDVSGCKLDAEGWDEVLSDWEETQEEEELFRDAVFQEGAAFLLGKGSTRGAILTVEPDETVHLRLNALASRADWRRAFQVVRAALEKGGGQLVREDGLAYLPAQLTDALAEQEAVESFCTHIKMMAAGELEADGEGGDDGPPVLPLDAFAIVLGPNDLPALCAPADVPGLEDKLAARVERMAQAYPATTMLFKGGLRLTTWPKIATLVGGDADLVSIEGLEKPVPLERVKALLGARAEDAGEGVTYLPQLVVPRDKDLIVALEKEGVDLEEWARANGKELPPPSPEDGDIGEATETDLPPIYAPLADAIARVVISAAQGQDPRAVRRALIKDGLDEQAADLSLHVVGRILGELVDPATNQPLQRTPEELVEALMADGLPRGLASMAVHAVGEMLAAFDGPGEDEPPPPPSGKTKSGLILPPGY